MTTTTFTGEDREKLKDRIDAIHKARKPLLEARKPLDEAIAALDELTSIAVEEAGVELLDEIICECCECILVKGDLGHRCADGPVLCEECSPTWAELLAAYIKADGETTSDRTPEELAEDQVAAQARVDAGDGDKKHVWEL